MARMQMQSMHDAGAVKKETQSRVMYHIDIL
jgi:hypothetical protein